MEGRASEDPMSDTNPKSVLEQISTCWPMIHNPVQFVMRYAPAIQRYVPAIVHNPHDAEEVAQDFLMRVFDKGFCPENVSHGRFRDYLKSAVRYAAISHLRKKRAQQLNDEQLAALVQSDSEGDRQWDGQWRDCLLERVWQALEIRERQTPGNVYFTVLRQFTDDPKSDSQAHAARLSERIGRPVRADAFRQQLSRARRQFASLIIEEVRRTLHVPSADAVQQELIDLELIDYVRDFLSPVQRDDKVDP